MMRRGQSNGRPSYQNNGRQQNRNDHDEPQDVQKEEARKPVFQLNYPTGGGSMIWVSVWDSSYEVDGKTKVAFSITYKRSYFHDNKWKTAENVRANELHVLIHALNQASMWCLEATRE